MGRPEVPGLKTALDPDVDQLSLPGQSSRDLEGGKPELTVCQVHTAVGALMPCWWLNGRASAKLTESTAKIVQYHQQRNAKTRRVYFAGWGITLARSSVASGWVGRSGMITAMRRENWQPELRLR